MTRIAWSTLMRAGLRELRLAPREFWDLTPAELMAMLGAGGSGAPLDRMRFQELSRLYPDTRDMRGT